MQMSPHQHGPSYAEAYVAPRVGTNLTSSNPTKTSYTSRWNRPSKLKSGHTSTTQRTLTFPILQCPPGFDLYHETEDSLEPLRRKASPILRSRHPAPGEGRPADRPRGPRAPRTNAIPALSREEPFLQSHRTHPELTDSEPRNEWTPEACEAQLAQDGFHGREPKQEQTIINAEALRNLEKPSGENDLVFEAIEEDISSSTSTEEPHEMFYQVLRYRGYLSSMGYSEGEIEVIIQHGGCRINSR